MSDTTTPECTGCNRDLQGRLAHYGTCPLAPKVSDALLSEAEAAYDRQDQDWFNRQSTEHLVAMWALCITINAPSWDDEVYDALAARGHWDITETDECDGCDQDPWRKPVHYGTCPLAPKEDA